MVSEVARNLGINANMLSRWKSELERPAEAREAESRDRRELNRLKKENRRLLMEQETLKKAAAFFARQLDDDTCSSGGIRGLPSGCLVPAPARQPRRALPLSGEAGVPEGRRRPGGGV